VLSGVSGNDSLSENEFFLGSVKDIADWNMFMEFLIRFNPLGEMSSRYVDLELTFLICVILKFDD